MPFFVLSLKAGGSGLNLTAASHVVHFDRWWNPAVENQATDRAFRIGQTKNVLVHKFVCRGTVEEKIDELIESKKQLSTELLEGGAELNLTELEDEELLRLVALDLKRCDEGVTHVRLRLEALRVRGRAAAARPSARWQKLRKKGHPVSPVVIEGRTIARTFWGKAWCDNLERYSDFANRLPRGRTYVRNGSVLDLQIAPGEVKALVSGSEHLPGRGEGGGRAEGAVGVHLRGLRGRDRLAGGAAARALLQGRHGAHLPAEDRALPRAGRDRVLVQLPRLGLDVQARRGRALRRRRPARRTARAAFSRCARWTRRT